MMNIRESKIVSLILMEMLEGKISKIIEDEIDKGENGNYTLVDLLVELYEVLGLSAERLGIEIE